MYCVTFNSCKTPDHLTVLAPLSPRVLRFLTGPANLKDPEAKFRFPKIFVSAEDGYEELHLIVYKVCGIKTDAALFFLLLLFFAADPFISSLIL